jgi:hypothetical protein
VRCGAVGVVQWVRCGVVRCGIVWCGAVWSATRKRRCQQRCKHGYTHGYAHYKHGHKHGCKHGWHTHCYKHTSCTEHPPITCISDLGR